MGEREYALAFLAAEPTIPSRTMLQKLVYLVAFERADSPTFRPYFYGPYSSELQAEIERLVAAGLVMEHSRRLEPWEPSPFEPMQYSYQLTEDGRTEARSLPADLLNRAAQIVAAAREEHAFNAASLSMAAKLRHLRSVSPDVGEPDVPELARQFGWRMTDAAARRGARLIARLDAAV